jgi:hypothetical protein
MDPTKTATISLVNKDNPTFTVINSVTVPVLGADVSYGRDPNNTAAFIQITTPTPGSVNVAPNPAATTLRINEVVSSNKNSIADYQGDHGDWIEIYNTSSTAPVNLKNILIASGSTTWQFPDNDNITIAPRGYLVIFCDGKNTVVNRGGGVYEVHTSFNISSSGEALTLYNTDRSVIDTLTMPGVPRDCSYGRYTDGGTTLREMTAPTPGAANTYATVPANTQASNLVINEILTDNTAGMTDEDGDHSAWVEVYNKGTVAVDLTGLRLTNGVSNWAFTQGTIDPGQCLLVFLSGKNNTGGE